ncbi:MAG TPA: hypothetical protein VNS10_14810 [Gemmatimonadaceae bacterium]|nr:hypothetical protein [Gemmatimonadaceae bacterium]
MRSETHLHPRAEVADSIAILNETYGKVIDSIWTPVAKFLAPGPSRHQWLVDSPVQFRYLTCSRSR